MKVSIEISHDWRASQCKCKNCSESFMVIRNRSFKVKDIMCPLCNAEGTVEELEPPWVGVLEEMR